MSTAEGSPARRAVRTRYEERQADEPVPAGGHGREVEPLEDDDARVEQDGVGLGVPDRELVDATRPGDVDVPEPRGGRLWRTWARADDPHAGGPARRRALEGKAHRDG
jgi:hypothetical protein